MTWRIALAATAILMTPAVVAAQTKADPPTTVSSVPVSAKKTEEERTVCKRIAPTGSRTIGKKVCRTAGEWAAEEADAKAGLDDVTRRSLQSAPKM